MCIINPSLAELFLSSLPVLSIQVSRYYLKEEYKHPPRALKISWSILKKGAKSFMAAFYGATGQYN